MGYIPIGESSSDVRIYIPDMYGEHVYEFSTATSKLATDSYAKNLEIIDSVIRVANIVYDSSPDEIIFENQILHMLDIDLSVTGNTRCLYKPLSGATEIKVDVNPSPNDKAGLIFTLNFTDAPYYAPKIPGCYLAKSVSDDETLADLSVDEAIEVMNWVVRDFCTYEDDPVKLRDEIRRTLDEAGLIGTSFFVNPDIFISG